MQHHVSWDERSFGPLPEFLDRLIDIGHEVVTIAVTRYSRRGAAMSASIIITDRKQP